FLFFSFLAFLHFRFLHSFPTRRSSDLAPWSGDILYPHQAGYRLGMTQQEHRAEKQLWAARGGNAGYLAAKVTDSRSDTDTGDSEDRKSTRLNSSHLGISYAVFCLKKKK